MIFCSENEYGAKAWKLVLCGSKTVTRRLKPIKPGKTFAVQPKRCEKAVGHIKILSCISHKEWLKNHNSEEDLLLESKLEGFYYWARLEKWFTDNKIDIDKTYRIEFELKDD